MDGRTVVPSPASLAASITTETPATDLQAVKQRQRAAWGCGDYAVIGTGIQLMAELLCEAADLHAGWRVLDVAAGSGNASLAAARRGCRVLSTDYVASLLERGKRRADADGLDITFQEADAEDLPFQNDAFDAVLSTVGVMFAPDQPRAAAELFRVCSPGGAIALACWTPSGFVGRIFSIVGKHLPPPAGMRPPSLWGTEERLRELFPAAASIEVVKRYFKFRNLSAESWLQQFRTFYGPMLKAFLALDEAKQALLRDDLLTLCAELNIAKDGTLIVPSEYLEVVVRKP